MAEEDSAGPPNFGLSDDQVAAMTAAMEQAKATTAEVHRLRGEYLSTAASLEGLLNSFLAMYFLRHRDDEEDHQQVLRHWYSWLLGSMGFAAKLDIVEMICKGGVGMDRLRGSGYPEVLIEVRQVNARRNQLAHSSVSIWPSTATDPEDYRIDVVTSRISRRDFLPLQPVEVDALALEVGQAEDVFSRLQDAWFGSFIVEGDDEA